MSEQCHLGAVKGVLAQKMGDRMVRGNGRMVRGNGKTRDDGMVRGNDKVRDDGMVRGDGLVLW